MRQEKQDHREEPQGRPAQRTFRGYAPPTSSTTYTPNQFFDVVLPNASRGCVRLVAYLIRKTLGWSDEHGNPVNPEAHISYRELIENAGVSRGAIKEAIDEAIAKRFVDCLRFGQPHKTGEEGYSALYSLRWDEREDYVTDPAEFDGFFAGNGNLTHIPNDFFDYTIPNEPLAVVKVVGVIIRNTIGYQTRFGFRRQQVDMSFVEIMRRTRIASSSTVSNALKVAIDGCHLQKVSNGVFDPRAGIDSKATTFSVRWSDEAPIEPKTDNGSKIEADDRFKNRSGDLGTVQKSKRANGSKIEAANGSESEAETVQKSKREAFKNRSDIKTTLLNNTPKQQQTGDAVGAAGSLSLLVGELMRLGVSSEKAADLVSRFPEERIRRQLTWLSSRTVKSNRAGLLIRAIEDDLPEPSVQTSEQTGNGFSFAAGFYAELAGNSGRPASVPSTDEQRAGEALAARLESTDTEEAGRAFARFVTEKQREAKFPVRTLGLAVRIFSDEFLVRMEDVAARRAQEEQARREEAEAEALKVRYEAFCLECAMSAAGQDEELQRGFEAHIEKRLASRKRLSERAYNLTLEEISDPDRRAGLLVEYIRENRLSTVPSFQVWRAQTSMDESIREEGSAHGG